MAGIFGPDSLEILVALVRHNIPSTFRFEKLHPDEKEEIEEVHVAGLKVHLILKTAVLNSV